MNLVIAAESIRIAEAAANVRIFPNGIDLPKGTLMRAMILRQGLNLHAPAKASSSK